ncbi:hypothetical protein ABK040_004634 [Willaertia magna]
MGTVFERLYLHTFASDFIDATYYNSRFWNFSKYIPDIVVINLGNNDSGALSIGKTDAYIKAYNHLIDLIISKYKPHNNNLKIVAVADTFYGDVINNVIETIVKNRPDYNMTVFWKDLYHLNVDTKAKLIGYNGQPSQEMHDYMAEDLYNYIRKLSPIEYIDIDSTTRIPLSTTTRPTKLKQIRDEPDLTYKDEPKLLQSESSNSDTELIIQKATVRKNSAMNIGSNNPLIYLLFLYILYIVNS